MARSNEQPAQWIPLSSERAKRLRDLMDMDVLLADEAWGRDAEGMTAGDEFPDPFEGGAAAPDAPQPDHR